ncbi:MAG: hypothetical protein AAF787_00225 [Chloroflexota bacterium]
MTFTYTPSDTPTDLTRVRFLIEDTVSPGLLSDAEISMAIATNDGNYRRALVPCINVILGKLSKESGVELDWLSVDRGDALAHYQTLKRELEREFSVGRRLISGGVQGVSRRDYGGDNV